MNIKLLFPIVGLLLLGLALTQTTLSQSKISTQQFKVKLGDFESRAELMYPTNTARALPTVLLVHAGFPSDLDGTFFENSKLVSKNLLSIAQSLSSQGFAVARYNKHHVNNANDVDSRYENLKIADFVTDAKTMLKTLLENPKVDPKRVFILGWSEGALVSTLTALEVAELRGVILMSPPVMIEGKDYGLLTPAKTLKQPVLILQGLGDTITEATFTPQLEKALAKNQDVTVRYFPKLGHGLGVLNGSQFSTIEPAPLHDLELWLKQHSP
jgi:dienelactone hydrolase